MSFSTKQKGGARAGSSAAVLLAASAFAVLPAAAQYPGQITDKDKNVPTMRAVAVLEWVGDLAHPKASRLVPITVWDGQDLQDGGIYLARPQPLALDSETEYELQKDGRNIGFYDIHEAARQQDSWIGMGAFKALPSGPTPQQLAMARHQKVDMDDTDSDTPILHRKHHADDNNSNSGSGNSGSGSGSNGPTLHKGGDASSGSTGSGNDSDDNSSASAPDPDRPHLHADTDSTSSTSASTTSNDPDRPKLHSPSADDEAHVDDPSAATDPDRPRLRRGEPANYGPSAKPSLIGLPPDLDQDVAISDTSAIKQHAWDYTWANPDDEAKMKSALEDMARKELGLDQPAPAPAKPKTQRTSVHRKTTPPPPPAPLLDEQFRVFELQYSAGATLVFSAHTDGTGAQQKFVTLVAQPDLYGGLVVLLKNVTDGAHLDVTPRMRLIDAVDALADNRGELLFELRGQSQRQFALYRVLRGQATKIFTTGASYWGTTAE